MFISSKKVSEELRDWMKTVKLNEEGCVPDKDMKTLKDIEYYQGTEIRNKILGIIQTHNNFGSDIDYLLKQAGIGLA